MFIFACSLAFIFGWTFALLGVAVAVGLGDAVVAMFALALVFELLGAGQPAKRIVTASKTENPIVRLIEVPPVLIKNYFVWKSDQRREHTPIAVLRLRADLSVG